MDKSLPQLTRVTDLRYRWPEVAEKLRKSQQPMVVMQHSTPQAILLSWDQGQKVIQQAQNKSTKNPILQWRKKYLHQFAGLDGTAIIRKMRDTRWNMSS